MAKDKFSVNEVDKLADLARIGLKDEERTDLTKSLTSVLEFVDALNAVDTKDVKPTSQVTGLQDVLREDEVVPCSLSRDELLANAPAVQDGYVKVQRVLQ